MTVVSISSPLHDDGGDTVSEKTTLICASQECQVEFVPRKHNSKFCSSECCKLEANRKMMEKYYERKRRRAGAVRFCIECETTRLSRYNSGDICGACEVKSQERQNHSVMTMIMNTSVVL